MKLAVKLSIIVGVGTLAIGLLTSSATFGLTKASLEASIGSNQLELAKQTMNKIDRLLCERLKDIEAIAEDPQFSSLTTGSPVASVEAVDKMLSDLTVLTGPWDRLYVASRDGIIAASSKQQDIGQFVRRNVADAAAFDEALAGQVYYSDFLISQATRKPTIIFAAPLRDRRVAGRPVTGVMIGLFAWPSLAEILDDVEAHTMLLNAQGVILGHNTRHAETPLLLHQLHSSMLLDSLQARQPQSLIVPPGQGVVPMETLASYAPQLGFLGYRGSGWGLILEVPTSIAFVRARDTAIQHAIVLIPMVLLGAAVLLWLMIRLVVKPVVALTDVTRHVAAGNLSKRSPVTSSDEIGELAAAFNLMTEKVGESYEALEGKIAQRTSALSSANDELQREMAERKKAQEAVESYARAIEQSNKELDDFTYIVSHDLKEPLRSIDAFSRFLEEGIQDKLDEEARGYLQRVRANAKRMQTLIEDLLAVSRLSKRANQLQTVDLNQLLDEVKARFEHVMQEKHVQLVVGRALPTITCDRVRLAEVFANLISNAIKYNNKPACIIEIGWNLADGWYEFTVKDNGPGIEPQYFEKIFEIFQRLGKREEQEGTGVGLTIVKKVVELHHGRIWVDSTLGAGATFHFTIPEDPQRMMQQKKLGAILLGKGLISEQVLDDALKEQERTRPDEGVAS